MNGTHKVYKYSRSFQFAMILFALGFIQLKAKDTDSVRITKLEEKLAKLNVLSGIKVSGYVQTEFQYGEKDASLNVGNSNENAGESFSRFGIRRGRIKVQYSKSIAKAVFQIDMTEEGLGMKDAYLQINAPWLGNSSLKAGLFNRPFGYEIEYSSSKRESPERSTIFRTLFPGERDLGAMLTLQAPKSSYLYFLKLDAGLFAGNGNKVENDSKLDFIGHLSASKELSENFNISGGVSYYNGSVYQGTDSVFVMQGQSFVLNNLGNNMGEYAKREYLGIDAHISLKSGIGKSKLSAEYILGTQPGKSSSSKSPNSEDLPSTNTYIRDFSGGYIMFVQSLGTSPISAVLKYDWYDPNTEIAESEIGLNNTSKADIGVSTLGVGLIYDINDYLRLTGYYDINSNELSDNLSSYSTDRKDNKFTLRLQYKY